jgi:hypothetical protein
MRASGRGGKGSWRSALQKRKQPEYQWADEFERGFGLGGQHHRSVLHGKSANLVPL